MFNWAPRLIHFYSGTSTRAPRLDHTYDHLAKVRDRRFLRSYNPWPILRFSYVTRLLIVCFLVIEVWQYHVSYEGTLQWRLQLLWQFKRAWPKRLLDQVFFWSVHFHPQQNFTTLHCSNHLPIWSSYFKLNNEILDFIWSDYITSLIQQDLARIHQEELNLTEYTSFSLDLEAMSVKVSSFEILCGWISRVWPGRSCCPSLCLLCCAILEDCSFPIFLFWFPSLPPTWQPKDEKRTMHGCIPMNSRQYFSDWIGRDGNARLVGRTTTHSIFHFHFNFSPDWTTHGL